MYHSKNINIHHARIHGLQNGLMVPNDDGIDVNGCERVHISDMDIQTGDDCIALFAGSNITITNSTLRSKSAGIRLGYYRAALRDVVVSNLVIDDSNRGINVNVRGGNTIENVLFSNIVIRMRLFTGQWWGKAEPINVSALVSPRSEGAAGFIRGLHFRDIRIEGEAGILVYAERPGMIDGLEFDGVHQRMRKGRLQTTYGGNFDLRGDTRPGLAIFQHDIPAFFAHGVKGLALRDYALEWDEALPEFYTHGVHVEDSRGVEIRNFQGAAARAGVNGLQLDRCEDVRSDWKKP